MLQDTQNTSMAATGGALINPTGNSVLDAIFGAANVAVTGVMNGYSLYATVKDREAARKIEKLNAQTLANQALAATQADGVTTLTQPEQIQKLFLYAGVGIAILAGAFYVIKKV